MEWVVKLAMTYLKRLWGEWRVLKEYLNNRVKIKELVVHPQQELSMQKHTFRKEVWFVVQGKGEVRNRSEIFQDTAELRAGDVYVIPAGCWHQLIAKGSENLIVIEIQSTLGTDGFCVEDDIKRI
jgi:mannose-6-phosphate isomerase-like protein (cupin superfamily)